MALTCKSPEMYLHMNINCSEVGEQGGEGKQNIILQKQCVK